MKRKNGLLLLFCLFMLISYSGFTNNITVTNLSLTGQNVTEHFAMVKFDISWENSWRTSSSPNNWDAAKDSLELMEDNLKESELLQKIQKTSGLGVNDIWAEIRMRGNAKLFLVEQKNALSIPMLLEAENTSLCSSKLLIMKETMIQEEGVVNYEQLLGQWKNWVTTFLIPRLKSKSAPAGEKE